METNSPTSPHGEIENDNLQPPIAGSPPQQLFPSPPEPIEDIDCHQQFTNSNLPNSPPQPEASADRQQHPPPEDVEDQQEPPVPPSSPPHEENLDHQQPSAPPPPSSLLPPSPPPPSSLLPPSPPPPPPSSLLPLSPPPTRAENPPENFSPNHESPISKKLPSPPPSTPPSGPEGPSESPNYRINPSPSPSPSPNRNSDHESPSPSSPAEFQGNPSPSPHPKSDHESPSPSSPAELQGNPSPRPNPKSDHESPSPSSPVEFQGNPSPKADQSPKALCQSPPLTAGSPSPPHNTLEPNTDLTPPIGMPLLLQAVTDYPPSKPQISPWTHQETANLIQAYQEKWYSLKKGPLKAGQWEEVAITVAARCGYDEPTKTSKQCRHKIEKLRKRYRAERGKPRSKANAWAFFKLMDDLEKGPLPISSSQPMALIEYKKPSNSNGKRRKNDDGDDDSEFLVNKRSSRSKNSNHHVMNGGLTRNLRFSDGGNRVVRGLRTPVVHKPIGYYREDNGEDEEEEEGGGGNGEEKGLAAQLAAEIKGFAEKFVKMENKKIEMIRDVEKYRLEMENKRMEMILESQQMLVESVNKAFSSSHKTHKLSAT